MDMKKTVDRVDQEIRTVTAQLKLAAGGSVEDGDGDEDDEMAGLDDGKPLTKAQVSPLCLWSFGGFRLISRAETINVGVFSRNI